MSVPQPRSIQARTILLVTLSTVVQAALLVAAPSALAEGTGWRHAFSTFELALVACLIWQGRAIVRWSRTLAGPGAGRVQQVARWCLASLVLCAVGDLINRNYLEQSYQWDDVIRASFLITSIWAFLPGYAAAAWANRLASRRVVGARAAAVAVAVSVLVGVGAFAVNRVPGAGAYPSVMMAAYTITLVVLLASSAWLVRAYGWEASVVPVLGCVLAVVADLLIATWWIAEDRFPTVEHANWILYFASLAMIQQLPFVVARRDRAA